jgi:hypothetical protein
MLRFEHQALGESQQDDRPNASAESRDKSILLSAAASIAPAENILIFRKPRPSGFLARLLGALHHSRRLQAQNILKAHRHLRAGSSDACQPSGTGGDTLSIAERSSPIERSFRIPAPSTNPRLAIIALAFLVFHVLLGTWMHRALPDAPAAQQKASMAFYGD